MIIVYFLQVFTFKRFVPGGRVVAGLELVFNIQLLLLLNTCTGHLYNVEMAEYWNILVSFEDKEFHV